MAADECALSMPARFVVLVLGEMVGVTEAEGTGLGAALEFAVRRLEGGGGPRCGARAVISNSGT
jgi:hypothetical protein